MTATISALYHQVLLQTVDGLFAISVAGDAEVDDHGRLVSPRSVFEEGSCLVAVEQEMPASAHSGREESSLPMKKELRNGIFKLQFTDTGNVKLLYTGSCASA